MASRPETLRILCFGDSLTEGFTDRGMRFEPYSAYMKAMLEKQGIGNMKIEVVTEGQSGELATAPGFERRMTAKCMLRLLLGGNEVYLPTFNFEDH